MKKAFTAIKNAELSRRKKNKKEGLVDGVFGIKKVTLFYFAFAAALVHGNPYG